MGGSCASVPSQTGALCSARPAETKNELKKKDDEFVKTLKGQAEDVDTLLQYMSRQFVEMQNAFKEEMDEIEGACLQVSSGPGSGAEPRPTNRTRSLTVPSFLTALLIVL